MGRRVGLPLSLLVGLEVGVYIISCDKKEKDYDEKSIQSSDEVKSF